MPGSERFIMKDKISWSLFPIPVALKREGTGLPTSFAFPSLVTLKTETSSGTGIKVITNPLLLKSGLQILTSRGYPQFKGRSYCGRGKPGIHKRCRCYFHARHPGPGDTGQCKIPKNTGTGFPAVEKKSPQQEIEYT